MKNNKMKSIFITLIVAVVLLPNAANAQTELNEYLRIGAENNPGLKAKFSAYLAALEKVPQVGTLPDPQVTFGYFISPVETKSGPQNAKVGFSQMFPWFGTLSAREDVVTAIAKSKYEIFEEAKSNLYFNLKSTYYNVYFVNKSIAITIENIDILNTFQQLSIIKIETGKSSMVDELRVQMEINELKNQLALLTDTKSALEIRFNKLLNAADDSPVLIPDELWDENLLYSKEALLDSIAAKNHLVKELENKILSWENQEIAAQKAGLPQISVGMDYIFVGNDGGAASGKDAILLPKIGITIPLYRKKYASMVQEAVLSKEATQYQKQDKQNQLVILFENGHKDYKDADRRIDLYQRQSALAEKSLTLLLTAYSSDGQNFEEVLRMERSVLKYALEYDKARSDKNAASAFINYLMGK